MVLGKNEAEVQSLQTLLSNLCATFAISERLSEHASNQSSIHNFAQDQDLQINGESKMPLTQDLQMQNSTRIESNNQSSNEHQDDSQTSSQQNISYEEESKTIKNDEVNNHVPSEVLASTRLTSSRHTRSQSLMFNSFQANSLRFGLGKNRPLDSAIDHGIHDKSQSNHQLIYQQTKQLISQTQRFVKSYDDVCQTVAKQEHELQNKTNQLREQESQLQELLSEQELIKKSANIDEFLRSENEKLDISNRKMKDKINHLHQENEELIVLKTTLLEKNKKLVQDSQIDKSTHLELIRQKDGDIKYHKDQLDKLIIENQELMIKKEELDKQLYQNENICQKLTLDNEQLQNFVQHHEQLQQDHENLIDKLEEIHYDNSMLHDQLVNAEAIIRNKEAQKLMNSQLNLQNSLSFLKQESVDTQAALVRTQKSKPRKVATPSAVSQESMTKKVQIETEDLDYSNLQPVSMTPRNQLLEQLASNHQDQDLSKKTPKNSANCLKLELNSIDQSLNGYNIAAPSAMEQSIVTYRSRLNSSNALLSISAPPKKKNFLKNLTLTISDDSGSNKNYCQITESSRRYRAQQNVCQSPSQKIPYNYGNFRSAQQQKIQTSNIGCQTSPQNQKLHGTDSSKVIKEVTSEGQSSYQQIKPFVLKIKQKPEYKPDQSQVESTPPNQKVNKFIKGSDKNFNKWLQVAYQEKDSWSKYGKIIKNETKFDSKALVAKYKSAAYMLEKEQNEKDQSQPRLITSNIQVIGELDKVALTAEKERTHISMLNRSKRINKTKNLTSIKSKKQIAISQSGTNFTTPTSNEKLRNKTNSQNQTLTSNDISKSFNQAATLHKIAPQE